MSNREIHEPLWTIPSLKNTTIEDLKEQVEENDYLTPREFAKLLSVHPQQVYFWIRKGIIVAETCKCGRTVICVSRAMKVIEARKRARGEALDTRPDQMDG